MADFLHVGDYITVYDDASDGYVGALGVVSSVNVGMREVSDPLHAKLVAKEAVFVLRQQHNYSVFRQMRGFLEREGLSAQAAVADPRYRQLREACEREKATNLTEFKNTCGREVRYGMIVQLEHVNSHKYLAVSRQSAELNADSRRVLLDAEAGESAWVRIMPRLRVHSEGEKVHVGDPVTLEHVQTGLRLLVDRRLADGRREVTATQQASAGFKLDLFRLNTDAAVSDTLLGSQLVRLLHKEAAGHLGCDRERADAEAPAYITPADGTGAASSNCVWQLVKQDPLDGSACAWSDKVRLWHVGSDTVLTVRGAHLGGSTRRDSRRSRTEGSRRISLGGA